MQINMTEKEWQHLGQMATIGELTTGIVHDLKNQLACIGANISLIDCLNENQALIKYIKSIERQVAYADEMANLMLRMGAKNDDHDYFDLALLMDDVARFFERVAGRGITVNTYVEGANHVISGCQTLISNSILNLCSNAKDAVGEMGIIEVSLIRDTVERIEDDLLNLDFSGDCSILTIRDSGCGIDSEKINDIFNPFFTTKEVASAHAGLGLANVMAAAREHGVSMTVDSIVGKGTTFKLYFKTAKGRFKSSA